ncbi:MAG: hypothetical protein GYA55_06345, partial [SAR324 cluster bacterium]|nr:hypothetical protein [SAR324 cluster bacterium]
SGHETVKLLEESRVFLKETGDTLVNLKKQFSEGAVDLSVKGAELTYSIEKTAEAISSTLDKYKNPQNILFGPEESSLGPGEEKLENAR